jgi:hypothetical protein
VSAAISVRLTVFASILAVFSSAAPTLPSSPLCLPGSTVASGFHNQALARGETPAAGGNYQALTASNPPAVEEWEPAGLRDLRGNEVVDAVATYELDDTGSLYEVHSPETELPRLASPTT